MKDPLGSFLSQWRVRTVLKHVRGRLLDIGCGANKLVRTYHGGGIGVDVFQWGDVDLIVKDSASLPFEIHQFDTVTIIAALNHIPNRTEVLIEAHRILRTDGTIILTMLGPRIGAVWHFLRRPWDTDQKERGMHEGEVYGMEPDDIHCVLLNAGFKVVSSKAFMFGLNRITIARKI